MHAPATAVVCLAGDAAEGIAQAAALLMESCRTAGYALRAAPEPPAEIRAPAHSLASVTGQQIRFGIGPLTHAGDAIDCLLALNPAALRLQGPRLAADGLLLLDTDNCGAAEAELAGYSRDPLSELADNRRHILALPLRQLHRLALPDEQFAPRESDRCRILFPLGLICWRYSLPLHPMETWLAQRYASNPPLLRAALRALAAGRAHGETVGLEPLRLPRPAPARPGRYRLVSGLEAVSLALPAVAAQAGKTVLYCGAPISPVSELLHRATGLQEQGVAVFQAEDAAGALSAALGAAFGGQLGIAGTASPGMACLNEPLGLAVMAELPVVALNLQRGGPCNGLPNQVEQADLLQSLFGRNGEAPLPVLAPTRPAEVFATVCEAVHLAMAFMTPVVILLDATVAQEIEPWLLPETLAAWPVRHPLPSPDKFLPFARDSRGVRPWAVPGTPGLTHRLGGLEKEAGTGGVSFDGANHAAQVAARAAKVAGVAAACGPLRLEGPTAGDLLLLAWGGSAGPAAEAARLLRAAGHRVSFAAPRLLFPLPTNLIECCRGFRRVVVAELNAGQWTWLLRARSPIRAHGIHKLEGAPFRVAELQSHLLAHLDDLTPEVGPPSHVHATTRDDPDASSGVCQ